MTQEEAGRNSPEKHDERSGKSPNKEMISQTRHTVKINGQEVRYTAVAGTMILKEEVEEGDEKKDGHQPKASVFYIAYTREDVTDIGKRPITFSFNGGPGSSSVWLHLGTLGPKRVLMDEIGNPLPPPYRLVENEHSLLDMTDLVFIDPVSTGYSRTLPGETPKQFHDFRKDIETVGEFIRLYITRTQRWASPKFLIGESYGTTRAASLSGFLQDRHGMFLNGVILVSSILNFQTGYFHPGNDLPYLLFLPTYTATAWYHGRLAAELQEDFHRTLSEVEDFALGEYTLALMKGDALLESERNIMIQKLARYTGLSETYVDQNNLRIPLDRFVKELLRDQRRTVGRLDSRFTGIDRDTAGDKFDFDPSYAAIQGPYTATLNDYVRTDLQFESDLPYEILTERVFPWSFDEFTNKYVNVAETLREAMSKNPHLKVFIANGYYDLATPYFATRYTTNHLGLDESLRGNISMGHYEAGHMMYIHQPSLVQLKKDLASFVRATLNVE